MGPHDQRQPWLDHALDLAVQEATGQLIIVSPTGDHNWLWFRDGQITGVSAPARRPLLAQRLVAFNVMSQQGVDKALAAARETPGTRLMDIILAEQAAPEAFLRDFLAATMSEQLAQIEEGGIRETRFRTGEARRISPLLVDLRDVIAGAHSGVHRIPEEVADLAVAVQPGAVVAPGVGQSFLNACDGHRRPAQIADQLGLTLNETMALLNEFHAGGTVHLLDTRAVAPPAAETMLSPVFPQEPADAASPPVAQDALADLAPPGATPVKPHIEPEVEEPVSAPYQPAQIPTSQTQAATPQSAPETPVELHQMAAEIAPTLPESADVPEHEEAPQHKIEDITLDRQKAAATLAGLANPTPDPPATPPADSPPAAPPTTPTAPAAQQRLTTSQAGTSAMRPDLLSELHSLGQEDEEPKPKNQPPPPPSGSPTS